MLSRLFSVAAIIIASIFATLYFSANNKLGNNDNYSNNSLSKQEINKAIGQYIKDRPIEIYEALLAAQPILKERQAKSQQAKLSEKKNLLENNPASPVIMGKNSNGSDSNNVIVKFLDYNCGYCKKTAGDIKRIIDNEDVKLIVKDFPILGQGSVYAAKASLAVFDLYPNKYQDFYLTTLKRPVRKLEAILNIVAELGINKEELKKAMNSSKYQDIINSNRKLAESLGISGTPAFVINGKLIPGAASYDNIKALLK